MLIKETWINKTENHSCGNSDLFEPYTENIKELFQSLQKEYGRCVSKMYIDPNSQQIGWVFEKRIKYEDCNEYFIQETWIELHKSQPDHLITNHYHEF